MKRHTGMIVLTLLVMVLLLLGTVMFQVAFTDYALILTFGRVTDVYDGTTADGAGLKFKWPWPVQKLVRYDARQMVFEDPTSEVPTRDKQNILLTLYCVWRIGDPQKFHATVQTVDTGQLRVRDLLRSAKKDVVGKYNLEDFINTDPSRAKIDLINQQVLESVSRQAWGDYGVSVSDVGVKTFTLPEGVSNAVINAMREERQREVSKYLSAGEAQAKAIEARAHAASNQIIEFANRKAAEIRTEGDRQAARYYSQFAKNERFSMFLRSLESLRKELSQRTVILLDASQLPTIEFFQTGPSLDQSGPPASTRQKPNEPKSDK